jgi:hypothetical protein
MLVRREPRRHYDFECDVQIATAAILARQPLAPQSQALATLAASWDSHVDRATQRRHGHSGSQSDFPRGDWYFELEIVVFDHGKERMGQQAHT